MAAAREGRQELHHAHEQEQEQKQEVEHKVMVAGRKSLLQSDALYQYILEASVYPREPAPLRELREMTANHRWNPVAIPADEGQFLMLLLKLMNAKNTIELGVYTGYSLLSTALALPDDGKIIAIDIHRQNYELGVPFMKKAGVHHKIDFREGHGLTLLEELVQDEKNLGFFDFVFVDADKDNYLNYHESILKLVKVGGLIGYDNTLWQGSVAVPDDTPQSEMVKDDKTRWQVSVNFLDDTTYTEQVKYYKPFVLEFNKALAVDTRIEISMVSIGDGITLCRRRE